MHRLHVARTHRSQKNEGLKNVRGKFVTLRGEKIRLRGNLFISRSYRNQRRSGRVVLTQQRASLTHTAHARGFSPTQVETVICVLRRVRYFYGYCVETVRRTTKAKRARNAGDWSALNDTAREKIGPQIAPCSPAQAEKSTDKSTFFEYCV
jgi:hypothetical protein